MISIPQQIIRSSTQVYYINPSLFLTDLIRDLCLIEGAQDLALDHPPLQSLTSREEEVVSPETMMFMHQLFLAWAAVLAWT